MEFSDSAKFTCIKETIFKEKNLLSIQNPVHVVYKYLQMSV